jgi:hypothetical protein
MLSNLIPTTGTAEQIEDAAFGFLQDSDGRELARAVEDERGVVCLDIGHAPANAGALTPTPETPPNTADAAAAQPAALPCSTRAPPS